MREHKFRAWDKKQKKWLGANLHMSVIDGVLWWQFGYKCEILSADERDNIELVEYSGLKLKNGKEIYEGDIIEAKLPSYAIDSALEETLKEKTIIGEVRIRPAGGTGILVRKIIGDKRGIQIGAFLKIKTDTDTIIGNIYENPELIEGRVKKRR